MVCSPFLSPMTGARPSMAYLPPSSWHRLVLRGVDWPALEEGKPALLGLLGGVVVGYELVGGRPVVHGVLADLVEGELLKLENDRAVVLYQVAVPLHLGFQLIMRDDRVDEPQVVGLLCGVLLGEHPYLTGPLLADHVGEVADSPSGGRAADPGAGLAEPRPGGGHREVAHVGHDVAGAYSEAIYHRYYGFRHCADRLVHAHLRGARVRFGGAVLALVTARAECVRAGARDYDDTYRVVLCRVLQRLGHLVRRAAPGGVVYLRTVYGDARDAIVLRVQNVHEFHVRSLLKSFRL